MWHLVLILCASLAMPCLKVDDDRHLYPDEAACEARGAEILGAVETKFGREIAYHEIRCRREPAV